MYRIGPTPDAHSAETLALARSVMPSTVGHMTDRGFAHGLDPLTPTTRVVGTAFTVRIPATDSTAVHYAVDRLQPGHVLVIDMGADTDRSCVGAMVAFTAKTRGAAGIIVDGMATDLGDLIEFDLPVFARGTTALTTSIRGVEGDINVPVSIGGVVVSPGQVVLADADGILFLDEADLWNLGPRAVAAQEHEDEVKEAILRGERLSVFSHAEELVEANLTRL